MLKKLQIKFVVLIMACVMGVILAVLGIFLYMNAEAYRSNERRLLEHELYFFMGAPMITGRGGQSGEGSGRENMPPEDLRGKYYFVALDAEGSVTRESNHTGEEDTAEYLAFAQEIAEKEQDFSLHLRGSMKYAKVEWEGTSYMIIASNAEAKAYYLRLLLLTFLIFGISFGAFLLLSLVLSKRVLKPVKKAWEEQERFVADASHELRTPISIVLANMNILKQHGQEPIQTQMRWIDSSIAESKRMQQLIESLLFLAKTDEQNLAPKPRTLHLTELMKERILSFEALAFEKGIDFQYEIEENCFVRANEGSVKQVCNILLDNAFKYCDGKKHIRVQLYKKNGKIYCSVQNSGDPIPKESISQLFKRFYRVDKSRARSLGGYGLGLSIAHTLCRQMGADIRVRSTPEEGTCFTLVFAEYKN